MESLVDELAGESRRRFVYLVALLGLFPVIPDPEVAPAFRAPGGQEWRGTVGGALFVSGVLLDREPETVAGILAGTLCFISVLGLLQGPTSGVRRERCRR